MVNRVAPYPVISGRKGEKWSRLKSSGAMRNHRRMLPSLLPTSSAKSPWKYSKAQLKAHMMLPEPLVIPKSVLYDYNIKKKKPQLQRPVYRSLAHRESSFDSGADDLSDSSSEHSEWDSLMFLGAEAATSFDFHRVPTLKRAYPSATPLPLSPAVELHHHLSNPANSRPLSPSGSMISSSNSSSGASLFSESSNGFFDSCFSLIDQSTNGLLSEVCNGSIHQSSEGCSVDLDIKSAAVGQLHFQCARCFIIYPSVELMEKHIGLFHMRTAEGETFELSEDNFTTLVKAVWDADLSYGVYTGYVRHLQEPALAAWPRPTPLPESHFEEYSEQLCGEIKSSSTSEVDSGLETDESSSYIGDELSVVSGNFDEDTEEEEGYGEEEEDDEVMSRAPVKKCPKVRRMIFSSKSGAGVTRKLFSDTMRKVNRIISGSGKRQKKSAGGDSSVESRRVPKKFKAVARVSGDSSSKAIKKGARKCRGVYGIDNQGQWCNMCKWKKRCSRFSLENDLDC